MTVCGIAGVGKIELMLQAAHTALASGWFPGGVLFADTGGPNGREASQILDGFLPALGVPASQIPAGAADRARLYALVLSAFARRDMPVLVLIDNAGPSQLGRLRPLTLPLSILAMAATMLLFTGGIPAGGFGGVERLAVFSLRCWMVIVGIFLLHKTAQGAGAGPASRAATRCLVGRRGLAVMCRLQLAAPVSHDIPSVTGAGQPMTSWTS